MITKYFLSFFPFQSQQSVDRMQWNSYGLPADIWARCKQSWCQQPAQGVYGLNCCRVATHPTLIRSCIMKANTLAMLPTSMHGTWSGCCNLSAARDIDSLANLHCFPQKARTGVLQVGFCAWHFSCTRGLVWARTITAFLSSAGDLLFATCLACDARSVQSHAT